MALSIKDRLNKPFTLAQETYGMGDISSSGFPTKITQVTYSNPVFAFFNIHSYKDDGITDEEYACQPKRDHIDMNSPDWFIKSVEFAKTQKDWYSWNNSNWGTKWDVAVRDEDEYPNTELIEYKSEGDDNWLVYKYETAWSPAVTILTKLSNLVPNCLLTLEFEEETGWGGEYEIVRGNVTELVEYENRCYACQSYDTLSYCEDECGEFCSECNEGSWQDEEALSMLSETSRGNARSCVLRAKEVKLYADRFEIKRFTKEDAEKFFFILDILPHGLNRIEWQILNILRKEGNCTLSMLAAKTGLSRTAIQRDHELYLIRKGFISIDNVRYITSNGCKVLELVKK